MLLPAPTLVHSLLVCRIIHINCCSSLNQNIEINSNINLSETLSRLLSSQTTLAQLPGLCHGAVNVGGVSVRLRGPEVHLQGEVRHRGHPKAAESQNQNDSNDERRGRHRQGHRQVRRQGHRQVRHRVIRLRKAQDMFR